MREKLPINSSTYDVRLRSIIKRKKSKILKKSLLDGEKTGEIICRYFVENLCGSISKFNEAKINLVTMTAKIIVERQLDQDPNIIISMVSNLLKNIAEHADIELSLHPTDAGTIKSCATEISALGGSARKITIVEDMSFSRGSIVIKADKSIIDAQIKTQIEKSKELILNQQEYQNGSAH